MKLLFPLFFFCLFTSTLVSQDINGLYLAKFKVCDNYESFKIEIQRDTIYTLSSSEKVSDIGIIRRKDDFYYFWSNRISVKYKGDPTQGIPVKIAKNKITMFSRNKQNRLIKTVEVKKVGT